MTSPDRPPDIAVSAQEADALDRWLETRANGEGPHPNGKADAASLAGVAGRFHQAMGAAERNEGPAIPLDRIWEEIMANAETGRMAELDAVGAVPASARTAPQRTSRFAAMPGYLSGAHWAVSAALVAVVIAGIFALYRSFDGDGGRIVDYEPATNSGFAASTPAATIDASDPQYERWLSDGTPVSCVQRTDGSNSPQNWNTSYTMKVGNYLPFSSASSTDQSAVAERWLRVVNSCAPTSADPVISDEFHWMPGASVAAPTANQLEVAQLLSAALPMQDYRSYYLIREATPEPGDRGDDPPVLLPQDLVALPDGRIGGPLRIVLESNDPTTAIARFTDGVEAAPVVFVIFENVDGQWLYDELITLCVGDCDEFWAEIAGAATPEAASPVATGPNAHWFQDPALNHCEKNALDPFPANPATTWSAPVDAYLPFAQASERTGMEIASQWLLLQADCAPGETGLPAISDDIRLMPPPGAGEVTAEQVETAMAISAALPNADDPMAWVIEGEPLPESASEPGAMTAKRLVSLPEDVVMLPDGRAGAPLRAFMQTNHPGGMTGYFADRGWLETTFVIFEQQNGVWAFDEALPVCIGACDGFWASSEVAPVATPVASPQAVRPTQVKAGRSIVQAAGIGIEVRPRSADRDGDQPK